MASLDETTSFEYRDRSLRRVAVTIKRALINFPAPIFDVAFLAGNTLFSARIAIEHPGEYYWKQTGIEEPTDIHGQVIALSKCLCLDNSYRYKLERPGNSNTQLVFVSNSPDFAKGYTPQQKFGWGFDNDERFFINHPLFRRLTTEEGRLGRRIALDFLYRTAKTSAHEIISQAHFPADVMERETNSLNASEFVAHTPAGNSFLTMSGREYFESDPWVGSNNVFIIAACHANREEDEVAHQAVLNAYKDYFNVPNSTYNPVFQEHEEPEKNIYVDIFNYIDECAFVIADITYDRPNCYVELGYALARGKHVIGYMQKEYFEEKAKAIGGTKIPFDLFPIKFFEYSKNDLGKLRESLEERVGVIKRRHNN